MNDSLIQAMARATDEELYEILHLNRAEYSEEAVVVAEEELRRRNLEPAVVEELQASIDRKEQMATAGLSLPMKLFILLCGFMCFGIPLIPLALVVEIVYREADTKYRDAWRWTGYGIAAAITMGVVCFVLALIGGVLGSVLTSSPGP